MLKFFLLLFLFSCFSVDAFSADGSSMDKKDVSVDTAGSFELFSPVFANGGIIPDKYTCRSNNVNPPLSIRHIPAGTKSMALTVYDPLGLAGTWVHWVVFNILPGVSEIHENSVPGVEALNDFGNFYYGGPCPPDEKVHRYIFTLYALKSYLDDVTEGATMDSLEKSMAGKIIQKTVLEGMYQNVRRGVQ